MNKLKIFIITAITVLGSCIFSFADSSLKSIPSVRPNDTIYKYGIMTKEYGTYYMLYTNGNFKVDDNYVYCDYGSNYKWNGSSWQRTTYSDSVVYWGKNSNFELIYCSSPTFIKYWDQIQGTNSGDLGGNINPPTVTPVIMGMEKIIPHLLEQLKILLPIGVTIFALLLGTRLVPRLIRLFQ